MNEIKNNLSWIDSLRGIAICMVVASHCGGLFKNINIQNLTVFGQMGVQLFFFLSSLTLSISINNRNENKSILKFYIRRIFRIFPLYYIGVLIYLINGGIILYPHYIYFGISDTYNFKNILANLTFIHGFYKPANNTIVPGGWSIGTEMIFYLLFPFLWNYAKKFKKYFQINIFLFTIIIISLTYTIFINKFYSIKIVNNDFYYFNIMNQISVFIIGMLYFENGLNKPIRKINSVVLFFLFLLFTIIIWKGHYTYSFYFVPLLSALSFWGLIDVIRNYNWNIKYYLSEIGKVSFSIYIFHFLIIDIIKKMNCAISYNNYKDFISFSLIYLVVLLIAFLIGGISNKYIEKPFIKLGNKLIEIIK